MGEIVRLFYKCSEILIIIIIIEVEISLRRRQRCLSTRLRDGIVMESTGNRELPSEIDISKLVCITQY